MRIEEQQMMLPIVGCDLVSDQCRGDVVEVFSYAKVTGYSWGFSHLCQACLEESRREKTGISFSVVESLEDKERIKRASY